MRFPFSIISYLLVLFLLGSYLGDHIVEVSWIKPPCDFYETESHKIFHDSLTLKGIPCLLHIFFEP